MRKIALALGALLVLAAPVAADSQKDNQLALFQQRTIFRSGLTKAHARILNRDGELRRYVGPIYWDIGGDTTLTREGYVMSAADWDCWRMGWSAHTCAKGYTREIRRKDGGVVLMHCIHVQSAAL